MKVMLSYLLTDKKRRQHYLIAIMKHQDAMFQTLGHRYAVMITVLILSLALKKMARL